MLLHLQSVDYNMLQQPHPQELVIQILKTDTTSHFKCKTLSCVQATQKLKTEHFTLMTMITEYYKLIIKSNVPVTDNKE
jgi:hypothetical protein